MIAHMFSMVRSEDNGSILGHSGPVESFEDDSKLIVKVRNESKVVSPNIVPFLKR